jgi:putative tryptophan/tyrosine transport system substrate-binding protein
MHNYPRIPQVRRMKRRTFIAALGGAVAWPLAVRAQQPATPVIGFLDARSPDVVAERLNAFRQGLKETGHLEGENVAIIYRFAENQLDRLPALAADLVHRKVAAIVTAGDDVVRVAKAQTKTIPILFVVGRDPVDLGLVASLSRPGGNLTGVNFFGTELVAKRLELLRELGPGATRIAVLVDPAKPTVAEATLRDAEAAAGTMGLQIQVLNVVTRQDIDEGFATFVRARPDGIFISGDTFMSSRRVQLVNLTMRHAIPATFPFREFVEIGGLMSYGANILDAFRQSGAYAGRILKGAKPAEMPVVQSTKFELVVNAQSARTLGLTVPPSLLARADEVIE